jgi:hypothetical protein
MHVGKCPDQCLPKQSLADFHVISWLTRLVSVSSGQPVAGGIDVLEAQLGGKRIGPKMRKFWTEWIQRDSFKKALVPAAEAMDREAKGENVDVGI